MIILKALLPQYFAPQVSTLPCNISLATIHRSAPSPAVFAVAVSIVLTTRLNVIRFSFLWTNHIVFNYTVIKFVSKSSNNFFEKITILTFVLFCLPCLGFLHNEFVILCIGWIEIVRRIHIWFGILAASHQCHPPVPVCLCASPCSLFSLFGQNIPPHRYPLLLICQDAKLWTNITSWNL